MTTSDLSPENRSSLVSPQLDGLFPVMDLWRGIAILYTEACQARTKPLLIPNEWQGWKQSRLFCRFGPTNVLLATNFRIVGTSEVIVPVITRLVP
jgi:hypothetical protein